MRTLLSHLAALALVTLTLAACTDQKDPLAPQKPDAMLFPNPIGPSPYPIITRVDFLVEIVAGDRHTCVRKSSGKVSCWGHNQEGQLGTATTEFCGTFGTDGPCSHVPLTVTSSSGLASATRLTAGWYHNCALDANGAAWCWGQNGSGEVGKGTGGKATTPTPVVGGLTFTVLSAGEDATCGSAKSGGTGIFCWGMFPSAPAPTMSTYSPSQVATNGFSAIAVSREMACGNIGSNNWLCWGQNKFGQLAADPLQMPSTPPYTWVHPIDGATNVSVSGTTTCADQPTGFVQCFGANSIWSNNLTVVGRLGNPSFLGSSTFIPQTVGALHGVAVGDRHACALDSSGAAFCWGIGDDGQLGAGNFQSSTAPVAVAGGHLFSALAAGGSHTCGIGTDNHVYCWGDNYYGQLGQPSASWISNTPVQAVDP